MSPDPLSRRWGLGMRLPAISCASESLPDVIIPPSTALAVIENLGMSNEANLGHVQDQVHVGISEQHWAVYKMVSRSQTLT